MKNIFLKLILLALIFGLFACNSNDDLAALDNVALTRQVGTGIYQAVVDNDGYVYVSSSGNRLGDEPVESYVYKLDPNTLKEVTKYKIGEGKKGHRAFGIGINNTTQKIYTTNTLGESLSVIDLTTNQVSNYAFSGTHLRDVKVDEKKNKIYISSAGGSKDKNQEPKPGIFVIDAITDQQIGQPIYAPQENTKDTPSALAIDYAKQILYVTYIGGKDDTDSKYFVAHDLTADNKVLFRLKIPTTRPLGIALDEAAQKLYIADNGSTKINNQESKLIIVDLKTKKVSTIPNVGQGTVGLEFYNGYLYAANFGERDPNNFKSNVAIIDPIKQKIISTIDTKGRVNNLAVDRKKAKIYLVNKQNLGKNAPFNYLENADSITKLE